MPTVYSFPIEVNLGSSGAVVTNRSAVTVSYADNEAVRDTPEGTIAPAASVTLYGQQWFSASGRAEIEVSELDASLGSLDEIRASLLAVESSRELSIRSYTGIDASGGSDMATLLNTISAAANAVAVANGYPYVTLGGFGRGVYRVDQQLLLRDRVRFLLDESRIVVGADLTGQSGVFRAFTNRLADLQPAVAQGTATTANGSYVLTAVSAPGSWSREDRITGTGIPADTKVVAVDLLAGRIIMDAAATASATVTITKAATYYGTMRNAGLIGGEIDPNGHAVGMGVHALWTENFLIDGTTFLHNRESGDENWAFCVGGRNMLAKNPRVVGGDQVFEDGFHFMHGQGLRLIAPDLESGDDAIALGGEIGDPSLVATPDPIRNVNITAAYCRSRRGHAIRIYCPDTVTGRDWETTDVVVNGLTGEAGMLANGGIDIHDLNDAFGIGGTTQVKRITIDGVDLKVGSRGHDDVNTYGLKVRSAADVVVNGKMAMTYKEGASLGSGLMDVRYSEDVTAGLSCDALGGRYGLVALDSRRVNLVSKKLRCSGGTLGVVYMSNVDLLIDGTPILDLPTGSYGVTVSSLSGIRNILRLRDVPFSQASTAAQGILAEPGDVLWLEVDGCDFSRLTGNPINPSIRNGKTTTINNGAGYSAAATSLVVADGTQIQPADTYGAGDTITVLRTREKMTVSSKSGNTLTFVARGRFGTTAQPLVDGDVLLVRNAKLLGNRGLADLVDAPYLKIFEGRRRFDAIAAASTPTGINSGDTAGIPGGAAGGHSVFYFDPTEHAQPGQGLKLRIVASLVTNATAPAANFTFGLYPMTPGGGSAGVVAMTAGTLVPGSTAVVSAPALSTSSKAVGAEFAAPAAGFYSVLLTLSADMAANSAAAGRVVLEGRAV